MRYTRIAAASATVATTVALATTLAGCSSAGTSAASQLDAAKHTTLTTESQIASFVPAASALSTHQTVTSKVIFPCLSKPGKSYWPGTTVVNLKPGTNTNAIMTAIETKYATSNGWLIVDHKDATGTLSVVITSNAGAKYTVTVVQGPQLSITGLSSCFSDDGLQGRKSY